MIGASVFLGQQSTQEQETYLDLIQKAGGKTIFTSLHIPEDDAALYKEALKALAAQVRDRGMKLYVDMSGRSMEFLGLSWKDASVLKDWGVEGIRMDYGIDSQTIANISKVMTVALNASTITQEWMDELSALGLQKEQSEVWHNYYPRPDTGLCSHWFDQKNRWFKKNGFKTAAFIPGNKRLRGPLQEGLPTLEKHRGISPFASYLSLKREHPADEILIGDPEISSHTFHQLAMYQQGIICLRYVPFTKDDMSQNLLSLEHRNRFDPARDVIRSEGARPYFQSQKGKIKADHTIERKTGTITIDNEHYGRYQGELQIVRRPLPAHEGVNAAGQIVDEDLPLIEYIGAGQAFVLLPVPQNTGDGESSFSSI
ncbi:MupG family TIM beta-alpha barrel fold protein [Jeotgalibacillus sp. ET6]|uniref:DUF871 domain-containing protein n=1 Tax=Jeotgalibacillus sp. ET6 TaxID=3037260 RepID=UPI0024184CD8|nr:MupG family TIM beta-alpha barrel fold protein [Jeotgalibacillus sp. ET6]MDG5472717.1 MupG family TIM beta-alpha barrel fold protein [Jeotgalibacillus sp. ET6]